ncbi:MAG: pyruvate kinase [Clostridia bacterium]|nr:pyruvate kinase [Clostridia bacterium]
MRKTKIVCTIGPSTDSEETMRALMLSGMNVARFNFSHGDYETHLRRLQQVVHMREELGLPVATMLDTKGPEIRLGKFAGGRRVEIADGGIYTLTTRDVPCTAEVGSVSFKNLPQDVSVGTRILVNDGVIELVVRRISETDVECDVIHGGTLSDNKGINIPGVQLSMPYLSERDMNDLEFGAKHGFDFIAASFVRSAADVNYLRKFTRSLGWTDVRIISKIENADGVENIDEIIDASDGIMIARGDMGVEIPFEQIPAIQKRIIRKGYLAGKQVITATQMLESMISNPRPTRAEITDVANAIYDGTSAIMLSGETAAGSFPIEAVQTMALIAETTEGNIDYKHDLTVPPAARQESVADAIAHATVTTAHDLNARAILTVSLRGQTARLISKYRPACPIICCTLSDRVCRQMNLSWGVTPLIIGEKDHTDALFAAAVHAAKTAGLIAAGDVVAITAGVPLGVSGTTNLMKVEKVE